MSRRRAVESPSNSSSLGIFDDNIRARIETVCEKGNVKRGGGLQEIRRLRAELRVLPPATLCAQSIGRFGRNIKVVALYAQECQILHRPSDSRTERNGAPGW